MTDVFAAKIAAVARLALDLLDENGINVTDASREGVKLTLPNTVLGDYETIADTLKAAGIKADVQSNIFGSGAWIELEALS